MGMKLLKKSEIHTLKAQERKTEIDQGMKLSRRVDVLRETVAAEEASLEAFRRSSVKVINDEIKSLTYSRDVLKSEIDTLEQERSIGMREVDAMKRDILRKETELTALQIELLNKINVASDLEKQNSTSLSKTQANEQRIALLKERADIALQDATAIKSEAVLFKDTIQKKANELALEYHERESRIVENEARILQKETDLAIEKERLTKLATELSNKDRAINDKYAALLQAQAHTGR